MHTPDYAELHCLSNFSFLRGASHPQELVLQAVLHGYVALALTDECTLAGMVRAHQAALEHDFQLIVGSEFHCADGLSLVLLAPDRRAYGDLSELITRARRVAPKGSYRLSRRDLEPLADSCLALWLPGATTTDPDGRWLAERFAGRCWMAVELLRQGRDRIRLQQLRDQARRLGLPTLAAGDVHMHRRQRRRLQDALTAIRIGRPLEEAGDALFSNAERHLRSRRVLARLYPPELLRETLVVAERCEFSLDQLCYEYPAELVPAGHSPSSWLRSLTEDGLRQRWPNGEPASVRAQVERELALVAELAYESYFLTVHDIVRFARSRGILCQGRGSAANSAVCFCLGITEVDPARSRLLFERFISRERNEPPDIDVDFEHERREEVIQYVYRKYGRERAALAATVISYRPRSALRDLGKALGFGVEDCDRLTKGIAWWDGRNVHPDRLREAGFDPDSHRVGLLLQLARELLGFPRHLSQHVGGFVIARDDLSRMVPVENAAMPDRTVIQWDKDDLDALGLLKVDCLALGMLSAIRRAFGLIEGYRGRRWTMAGLPAEDPAVYGLIQRADTVGVFQIESRAQMSMLPRLRPACFYDLVIEVAIVRPGPIQGDMVHPYLRRRQRLEAVDYPSEAVRSVLERTLGVPIFQEQVIELAMVAAGFSGGEADRLRRSMAAWRRSGELDQFESKLIDGMRERGYDEDFARRIFNQIRGFGEYGFPESHAASFALLVYVSAWLKTHEPAAFYAALLNAQPLGFYSPSQLVQDAMRHDIEVRPVDVFTSGWECTLEPGEGGEPAMRLGFNRVKGFPEPAAERLVRAREVSPFVSVADLARRSRLNRRELDLLSTADAMSALAGHRNQAVWEVNGVEEELPLFAGLDRAETPARLPCPALGREIVADYASLGLTLRAHPLLLLRPQLRRLGLITARQLELRRHGQRVRVGGLVTCRQRPGTATGVVFLTLEDETGNVNIIVWSNLVDRYRRALLGARLLAVWGEVQREGEVIHVLARHMVDHSGRLGDLHNPSRDFH